MPRGRKFTAGQWLQHKASIQTLWIEEGRSFAEVAAELAKVEFYPTKRQFEFQVSKWGFSKYTKSCIKETLLQQPGTCSDSQLVEAVFGDRDYIVCDNKSFSRKTYLRWQRRRTKHLRQDARSSRSREVVQRTGIGMTPNRGSTSLDTPQINVEVRSLAAPPRQTSHLIWSRPDALLHNDETFRLAYEAQLRCEYGRAGFLYRVTAQRLREHVQPADGRLFTVYRHIAACLINQGDYRHALQINRLLFYVTQHFVKMDDPRRLSILFTMAALYEATGKLTVAENYHQEVLQLAMQKFGLMHNFTITAMSGLASILRIQNKLKDSERLYSKVLQLRLQMSGSDLEICQELRQFADVMSDAGRVTESLQLYRTAEQRSVASLGELHHITLRVRSNLAADLRIAGFLDVSAELFRSTIINQMALLGEHHPDVSWSSYQYAKCLMAMGCYDEALVIFQKILLYRRQQMGEFHVRTLNCCIWTGWCSERVQQLTSALAYYQHVLNRLCREAIPQGYSDTYRVRWLKKAVSRTLLLTDSAVCADNVVLEMILQDAAQRLEIANKDGSPVQCIIEEESDCAETCAVVL